MEERNGEKNAKIEIIQDIEAERQEQYLYTLRKMAGEKMHEKKRNRGDLYNLSTFFYLCGELMVANPEKKFAAITMDIAEFKAVNEFCGRMAGDKLLYFISDCFAEYQETRPDTYGCHIRADNFCMCTSYEKKEELIEIVEHIREQIEAFPLPYRILPSFGICEMEESNLGISHMKDCATLAMNSIKGKFFYSYAFYDETMHRQVLRERMVQSSIVSAMENQELVLYVQPKVNMRTGHIIGGEALVRWKHPQRGLIPPGEFIPVLEKNGFIINVDAYIWEKVFDYLETLHQEARKLVPISVNISRAHAYDNKIYDTLSGLRDKHEALVDYVPLELTESAFVEDEEGMYNRMRMLREQGFGTSMDDFGSGYSTMKVLKEQPVDEIKVDRTLIMDIENEKSRIVVRHIISMLKELGVDIIIEGVETEAQKEFLLECGCDNAQGFLFYKPMPVEEFDALLRRQELAESV